MHVQTKANSRALLSLIPFLSFLVIYIGAGIFLSIQGIDFAFYQFPAASSALIAFGVALIIGYKDLHGQVRVFASGVGEETVVFMLLIFLLAGAFASLTKAMGAVDASVSLGMSLLPDSFLLPGLFLISCFVSLAMGTSVGTISAVGPIALGIAQKIGLDVSLCMGTVVGGAMFGDNLSVISDTTIAAVSTQGCEMRDKMRANLPIAVPAALIVTVILVFIGAQVQEFAVTDYSFIKTIPYFLVLILALLGINVIAVLMVGIVLAAVIGLATSSFDFIQVGKITYEGFTSVSEVFYLAVLIAGLAALVTKEGGLDYLLAKVTKFINSKRSAETGIALFVSIADILIAFNTVAVLVTGKAARELSDRFGISRGRTANLLDIYSCVCQGLIPWGAQLLLAGSLAQVSPFEVIKYTWYPMVLFVVASLFIIFQWQSDK